MGVFTGIFAKMALAYQLSTLPHDAPTSPPLVVSAVWAALKAEPWYGHLLWWRWLALWQS